MDHSPTSRALTDKGRGINRVPVVGSYYSEFTLKQGSGPFPWVAKIQL